MEIEGLPKGKKIILFDGVCNLCDASVQFIIKRDRKDIFRFVALQSELGQKIVSHIGVKNLNIDSIILYEPKVAYYYKAEAIFKIVNELGGIYKIFKLGLYLPKSVSNLIYDYVAKNRYKWYGQKPSCMVPSPEIKAKFL